MWDVTTIAHKSLPLLTTCLGVTIEQAEECQRQRGPWVPAYKEHGPYQIMEIIACHVPFVPGDPDALVKLPRSIISLYLPILDTKSSESLIFFFWKYVNDISKWSVCNHCTWLVPELGFTFHWRNRTFFISLRQCCGVSVFCSFFFPLFSRMRQRFQMRSINSFHSAT